MPAWQPNWTDVAFDYFGAEDAIQRARQCRRVLEDRDMAFAGPLADARLEWRGNKRIAFDQEEERLTRRTHGLIDALSMAEQHVRSDIDEAHAEQGRRVAARERYSEEVRAEEALARAQADEAARVAAAVAAKAVPTGTTTMTTTTPTSSP